MVLKREQRYSDSEAEELEVLALQATRGMGIEMKIRYLLSHGNSRIVDLGKQMALPGAGMILFADFTGVADFATEVTHVDTGNLVYRSLNEGEVVECFHLGPWTHILNHEYSWIAWKVDNPRAADIVDRFGVLEDD